MHIAFLGSPEVMDPAMRRLEKEGHTITFLDLQERRLMSKPYYDRINAPAILQLVEEAAANADVIITNAHFFADAVASAAARYGCRLYVCSKPVAELTPMVSLLATHSGKMARLLDMFRLDIESGVFEEKEPEPKYVSPGPK